MSGEQFFCNQLKQALNFYKIPLFYCSFCASYITLSPSEQFCVCTLSNRYKTSASKLFLVSSIALLTKVRSLLRRPLIRLIAATDSCSAFKAFRQSFSLEQIENKLQQARQLRWLRVNEVSISSFASTWLPRQKCISARLLQANELLALISRY